MAKIQDAGEKIGGARKDEWRKRGITLEDYEGMTEEERSAFTTKDLVWPKPDYEDLYKEEGIPIDTLYFRKLMRDAYPAKAAAGAEEEYVKALGAARDACAELKDFDDVANLGAELLRVKQYGEYNYHLERSDKFKMMHLFNYRYGTATRSCSTKLDNLAFMAYKENKAYFEKEADAKNFLLSENEKLLKGYRFMQLGDDVIQIYESEKKDGSVKIDLRVNGWIQTLAASEEVKGLLKPDAWCWIKDGSSDILSAGYASREEAVEALIARRRELKKGGKDESGRKQPLRPKFLEKCERKGGEDHIGGRTITGDDFVKDFGFRGIEFGNWLNDKDRQANLDLAYEAFCDMADCLGVDRSDIGLDGRLALRFGSNGRGGANAALAHYEPSFKAINLTKLRGAGSLGHEMFHAIDFIVGEIAGFAPRLTPKNSAGGFSSIRKWEKDISPVADAAFAAADALKYNKTTWPEHYKSRAERDAEAYKDFLKGYSAAKEPEDVKKRDELIDAAVEYIRSLPNHLAGRDTLGYDIQTPDLEYNGEDIYPAYEELEKYEREAFGNESYSLKETKQLSNKNLYVLSRDLYFADYYADKPVLDSYSCETTAFYRDAKAIDARYSKAGHGYWQSDAELFARAGAAYLTDKCAEKGIKNDYLNAHSELDGEDGRGKALHTAPQGEERKKINKAFDALFDALFECGALKPNKEKAAQLEEKRSKEEFDAAKENKRNSSAEAVAKRRNRR